MKIVNLDQRSDAWKVWRNEGVTASENAIILDKCDYKTRWRLWAEKTGKVVPEDLSNNPNVKRGVKKENMAGKYFEDKHDEMLLPICAESDENPVIRASMDGLTSNQIPVELKAPSDPVMDDVIDNGEQSKHYRLYWYQVQHQIYVTDAEKGYLCFYHKNEDTGEVTWREFVIQRDREFMANAIPELLAFHDLVLDKKPPTKDPERDDFVPENIKDIRQWKEWAATWLSQYHRLKELEAQQALLKTEMQKGRDKMVRIMGGFAHGDAFGVRVTRYQVQGKVDWEKVRKDLLPDVDDKTLDAYRKPSREQIRIQPSSQEDNSRAKKAENKAIVKEASTIKPDENEGAFAW